MLGLRRGERGPQAVVHLVSSRCSPTVLREILPLTRLQCSAQFVLRLTLVVISLCCSGDAVGGISAQVCYRLMFSNLKCLKVTIVE